ncbi:MAG: hypothetical protein JW955_03335 [Sedimentisphaerales bacterium]|nr:hypothetical protein [Sedimentisphaerales bacterium]
MAYPLTCDTTLTFTTAGDGNWFATDDEYWYYDDNQGDSAQSGAVGDSEETWLETTVGGPGTIKFYWKTSAANGDRLTFYVDGQWERSIDGNSDWLWA